VPIPTAHLQSSIFPLIDERMRLGTRLRQSARDNKLGDVSRVFRRNEEAEARDPNEVLNGVESFASQVMGKVFAAELDYHAMTKPFPRVQVGEREYVLLQLEVLVESEETGFGADSTGEDRKQHLTPHSFVALDSGEIFLADAKGEPALDAGPRANVCQKASLEKAIQLNGLMIPASDSVAEFILGAMIDPDLANDIGETALIQAARNAHFEICEFLLKDGGASPNKITNSGTSALMLAAENGSVEHGRIIELMIAHGAEVNAANKWGTTSLHAAAFRGNLRISKLLIDRGAKTTLKDLKGKLPKDYSHKETCFVGTNGHKHYDPDLESLLESLQSSE